MKHHRVHHKHENPTPVVRRRVAQLLDALSEECVALAQNDEAAPESYGRVLRDLETVAEILRESELSHAREQGTEWTLADRAHDAHVERTIHRGSGTHAVAEPMVERSGWCRTLTREDAQRTIEELRNEDELRHDMQRAIG